MSERTGLVTMGGKPLTLLGGELKAGDKAPDFTAIDNYMGEKKLSEYEGKVVIALSVPSLDTPVCETETKRFNQEAAGLGDDVQVLAVSMDLPFAQKRWCAAQGVENVETLSDHRDADFGNKYGVLIKENRLLARAVFVIGKSGKVGYVEVVPEIAQEPDYDSALSAAKALL